MQFEELKRITEMNNKIVPKLEVINEKYNVTIFSNGEDFEIELSNKNDTKFRHIISTYCGYVSLNYAMYRFESEKITYENIPEILDILIKHNFDYMDTTELENYLYNVL